MRRTIRTLALLAMLPALALPAAARAADADAGANKADSPGFAAAGGGVAIQTALPASVAPAAIMPSAKPASLLPDRRSAAALGQALAQGGVALPGEGLDAACQGFVTLYRCVATMHMAQNLKLEGGFAAAREMLVFDREASLADVARAFAPEADPLAAERQAQGQAMGDLRKAGIVK
ncbi:hypothetical protein [Novosphingobium sp.]|uniref:hypothetical protein n=1 Tax=Novosphingobium sp. TaxID=1874826 RepID=UPI0025F42F6F|nr:hypothetical protein [Novosphingobium sp.]MCC6926783.1 hypothetical protein [Novosphingobium sp.]